MLIIEGQSLQIQAAFVLPTQSSCKVNSWGFIASQTWMHKILEEGGNKKALGSSPVPQGRIHELLFTTEQNPVPGLQRPCESAHTPLKTPGLLSRRKSTLRFQETLNLEQNSSSLTPIFGRKTCVHNNFSVTRSWNLKRASRVVFWWEWSSCRSVCEICVWPCDVQLPHFSTIKCFFVGPVSESKAVAKWNGWTFLFFFPLTS